MRATIGRMTGMRRRISAAMNFPESGPTSASAGIKKNNLGGKEARANTARDCLGAGAHAELREHRGQVVFHRVSGEIELRRDFLVPQAPRDQPKHVQLARRECRSLPRHGGRRRGGDQDRKSTRLNSSHLVISYAVFCLKKISGQITEPS